MSVSFALALAALAVVSFLLAPRAREAGAFFAGRSDDGAPPGVLTLTFSLVTTWIFARSLLTAAILAFYYGIAGAIAYAAYYLSFFTGLAIVESIRHRHGYDNLQGFLADRFGRAGTACFNVVIGVRLLSEVFANLLVIGLIFGATGTDAYTAAIIAMTVVTLAYSMLGGLRASLRTDVFQMSLLLVALAVLLVALFGQDGWSLGATLSSSGWTLDSGWNLFLVALLQVWSYPMHDPVMMDRGFLADRRTTRRAFVHAGWISILCILAFAALGVHAGLLAGEGESLNATLDRLFGPTVMTVFNLALIVSALSTLDSTLSSSAKLAIVDMKLGRPTIANGRIAMAVFTLGGVAFLFGGTDDLYAAVAVSGTASMYLAPVIFFSIWGGRDVALWSYLTAFAAAMAGAGLYFLEAGGHLAFMGPVLGVDVKYDKLLVICIAVLVIGNGAFAIGQRGRFRQSAGDRRAALDATAGAD